MTLPNSLVSEFVKVTKDTKKEPNESTVYGTIIKDKDTLYVQLDGSDLLTPISTTIVLNDGDRVMVTLKNHEAIVTGDLTNPAASDKEVKEIGSKITEFEIIIADKVSTEQLEAEIAKIDKIITDEIDATNAKVETIEGKVAEIDTIKADVVEVEGKVTAQEAEFTTLRSDIADFKNVTTENIESIEGDFYNLNSDYAEFKETTTNKITANEGSITKLETEKLDVENGKIYFAQINFANITEAAIEKLFADSGIIKDLIMSEGKVTGELVGVTIKGDLIEAGTLKADKLIILGTDGLYYKLNLDALGEATVSSDEKYQNGLDGTAILAESITAEKIAVDDLVAFDATIGGFQLTEDSLYSGVKNTVDNNTSGIYLDIDGQIVIGDENEFIKYSKDEENNYSLEISAKSMSIRTYHEETVIDEETGSEITETVAEDIDLLDTINNVNNLTKSVETKISSTEASIMVKNELENYGAPKVVTTTGFTFDETGLNISKSGREMSTNIDEDGMSIYKNDDEVLTADNQGVTAYNLHAKTYLIMGDTSRFEDFIKDGKKRTGCFWIG